MYLSQLTTKKIYNLKNIIYCIYSPNETISTYKENTFVDEKNIQTHSVKKFLNTHYGNFNEFQVITFKNHGVSVGQSF